MRTHRGVVVFLALLFSITALTLALSNPTITGFTHKAPYIKGTTSWNKWAKIADNCTVKPSGCIDYPGGTQPFQCESGIPCKLTFSGMQKCISYAKEVMTQTGIPNTVNCINDCCVVTSRQG